MFLTFERIKELAKKRGLSLNQVEEKQFQKWLEARIGAKSIYVLNEN